MSSLLGLKQTLELLESLKNTVRDFAVRETKLNQEFRIKITAGQNRRDEAVEELSRLVAGEIAEVDASHHAAREVVEAKFKIRKSTIAGATKTSHKE